MNAIQSKQVLALLNEAIEMLKPCGHQIYAGLCERRDAAMMPAPVVKIGKLEIPNGKLVIDDLADPMAYHEKANAKSYASYWYGTTLGKQVSDGTIVMPRGLSKSKGIKAIAVSTEYRDNEMDRLSRCACGGMGHEHAADELENLLKCSHCDTCEAFHYQQEQAA